MQMENEQAAGAHYVCPLLRVFDHQCDVRRQDNILPSICMTFGHFRMYMYQHHKRFEVAINSAEKKQPV